MVANKNIQASIAPSSTKHTLLDNLAVSKFHLHLLLALARNARLLLLEGGWADVIVQKKATTVEL
jgi:hypothetical protein